MSGVLAGYLFVLSPILAGAYAWLRYRKRTVYQRRAKYRESPPVLTYRESSACREALAVEPWTPAEREALGVNDTDALITRIDRELRLARQEAWRKQHHRPEVDVGGSILGRGTWIPDSFVRDGDGVWIQR